MNRVRQYNKHFEVLITPNTFGDDGIALMLGLFNDQHLKKYQVKEFDSLQDAMAEALDYPDIDWKRMILFHKDIYVDIYGTIKKLLHEKNFIVDLDAKIMTPELLKNVMFDRVLRYGKRFTLAYDLNDVIGYHIINPWSKNLKEIFNVLKAESKLKINKYEMTKGVIRMVGETDIGTSYEIVLWPTLIAHWAKWNLHNDVSSKSKENTLEEILYTQEIVDKNVLLR